MTFRTKFSRNDHKMRESFGKMYNKRRLYRPFFRHYLSSTTVTPASPSP
jgi:hypothetical protein